MKNSLYLIIWVLCASVLVTVWFPTSGWSKDRGLGFVLDGQGRPQKVIFHTRTKLVLGFERGFPFVERPDALSIMDTVSGKEIARIKLKQVGINLEGYALDADRIVLNGVVWDWRKNQLRTYTHVTSSSPESISGISPDEKLAISVPSNFADGLIFHDIERGTSVPMYKRSHVYSPRFSPDGTRWAFFTKDELILRWIGEDREKRVSLTTAKKYVFARHLAWSPSGRYIAGLVHREGTELVIWDSDGNHLKNIRLPLGTARSWPPIWVGDEKSVYIVLGCEGLVCKFEPLQLKLVPLLK